MLKLLKVVKYLLFLHINSKFLNKKVILLFLICIWAKIAYAQHFKEKPKNSFYINLSQILLHEIQLSYEFEMEAQKTLEIIGGLQIGIPYNKTFKSPIPYKMDFLLPIMPFTRGFSFGSNVKFYSKTREKKIDYYFGAGFLYRNQSYKKKFIHQPIDFSNYYQFTEQSQNQHVVNLKLFLGKRYYYIKGFENYGVALDTYMGLGIGFKFIMTELYQELQENTWFNFGIPNTTNKFVVFPGVYLGVKLAFIKGISVTPN